MLEYGKARDDERNLPLRKFVDQLVAMRMLAIKHRKIAHSRSRTVQPFEFAGDPARFVVSSMELNDAHALAFSARRRQKLLRKIGADLIQSNHLRGHPQNIWCGAIVLRQRHAERRRILPGLPSRK